MKTIAEEIEEEVTRVELIPPTVTGGLADDDGDSNNSYTAEESLIEQLEKQSEFWRQNYYKPWRYDSFLWS